MKKVLFLPLLQMQSGHHKVAEALMDSLERQTNGMIIKKVDLLSYTNKPLEKVVTKGYLQCLRYTPGAYNLFYRGFFNVSRENEHAFTLYQHIFIKKMEKLLLEEKPDLIICTHAFPSKIMSYLKMKGRCHVPVINVYTDFFINGVWGKEAIDFHFLPNQEVKEQLIHKHYISEQLMTVTGIPLHEEITTYTNKKIKKEYAKVLISGGNCGLGGILKLKKELIESTNLEFIVLCGDNKKLYKSIIAWGLDHVKPVPYISSREEMNLLYDEADAIITKAGGVTISEAIRKRIPVFVHSALPGQEGINLEYLIKQKLVFSINPKRSIITQLSTILGDAIKMNHWEKAIHSYSKEIETKDSRAIVDAIEYVLYQQGLSVSSGRV